MCPLALTVALSRGYPIWFFFALLFLCILLVTWFYVNHVRTLTLGYFSLLFALRVLVVIVLLLFIFEPELIFHRLFGRRPRMLVLLDASRSMSYADPSTDKPDKRIDIAKSNIRQGVFLSKLRRQFRVHLYKFGATAEPLRERDLDDVEATAELTDLSASAANAYNRHDRGSVGGILLLTEGIDNSGKQVVEALGKLGVPIHCVAFGTRIEDTKDFRNVGITGLEHDNFVPKDNTTEIKVLIDAVGYGNQPARVVFRDKKSGKPLSGAQVVLDTKKGAQRVTLKFTPTKIGRIDGAIEVGADDDDDKAEPFPEEVRRSDNRKPITLNVTGPRIKVLYIEGVLREECRWIIREFQKDPNIDLLCLVQNRPGNFLQRGNIKNLPVAAIPQNLETWKKFDVIMLGDVHRSLFTTNQLIDLEQAVKDAPGRGRGLLLIGGVTAVGPGKYAGTPVEALSPVWFGSATIGQETEEFSWRLTDDGQVHPILSGITHYFPTADGPADAPMEKLAGCTRVGAPKPNATVLAVHPTVKAADGKPMAVVAVADVAPGRSMLVAADTTHRWHLPYRGLGRDSPYIRFWGQAIRWLASEEVKRDNKPGINAYTDKSEYEPGEAVKLTAYVRDPRGQATGDALVTVSILDPTKHRFPLQLPGLGGKRGEYHTTWSPTEAGQHEAVFEAKLGDDRLGEAQTVTFTVGKPDVEMADLSLNDKLLRRIADKTGGTYCTWLGLTDLAQGLVARQAPKTEPVKVKLHHPPLFLIIFILIAAAEWYLRKRIQLA